MIVKHLTGRVFSRLASLRQFLAAGIAFGAALTAVASGTDTAIHQEIDFEANAERSYEALLDEKEFVTFSGAPAQIHREAGGAFTLIGGRVTGRNIELIPNQRIVQAWCVETWPSGFYSTVRFELTAKGSGTRIVFDQTGFPPADRDALNGSWSKKYWDPLRQYLDGANGGWSQYSGLRSKLSALVRQLLCTRRPVSSSRGGETRSGTSR